MTDEPLSTVDTCARLVVRDDKGRATSERHLPVPAGVTYLEAVAYATRYLGHREEIAQFDEVRAV
jgi:hypothetical protein